MWLGGKIFEKTIYRPRVDTRAQIAPKKILKRRDSPDTSRNYAMVSLIGFHESKNVSQPGNSPLSARLIARFLASPST